MQDFNDKVAVITGGASGVGRSLAFALGRRGAKIVVGDVDKAAMAQMLKDLGAENIEAIVEFCDVTSVDSLNALADKAEEALVVSTWCLPTPVSVRVSPVPCGTIRRKTGSGVSTSICGV